ncbi:MAG: cyclase family protein [Nitrososphaerota archaeon]|nr:cyclase family protein [Nitrososphaerota archaeon]
MLGTKVSRFGKDDEIGAMNLQTPKSVVAALRLARSGRIFSLSHTLEDGMPVNWFHQDFVYSTYRSAPEMLEYFSRSFPNSNRITFTNLRMELSDHTGTHIDGLNHAAVGNRFYNGVDTRKVTTTRGTKKLGIETMPPLISRGVLMDMTLKHRYDKRELITVADCQRVLALEGISVNAGDTVLIYTGWERFWKTDNQRYLSSMPGIGVEAARWLAKEKVVAVGSDTQSVEVEPNEDPSEDGVVHQMLIVENGIHLIENLRLSLLARAKVYQFLFVCLPLKIRGGTGSPIHPIAVA